MDKEVGVGVESVLPHHGKVPRCARRTGDKVVQLAQDFPSLPVPRCACHTGDQGWSAGARLRAHFRSCKMNPQGAVGEPLNLLTRSATTLRQRLRRGTRERCPIGTERLVIPTLQFGSGLHGLRSFSEVGIAIEIGYNPAPFGPKPVRPRPVDRSSRRQ